MQYTQFYHYKCLYHMPFYHNWIHAVLLPLKNKLKSVWPLAGKTPIPAIPSGPHTKRQESTTLSPTLKNNSFAQDAIPIRIICTGGTCGMGELSPETHQKLEAMRVVHLWHGYGGCDHTWPLVISQIWCIPLNYWKWCCAHWIFNTIYARRFQSIWYLIWPWL